MYFFYFFPVGLDLTRRRKPWLSAVVVGSMLVVFMWQQWLADRLPIHPWDLVFYVGEARPWTALTALWLHAGWWHLAGNLVYLAVFMPALEEQLGSPTALLIFIVAGVGGNLAHGLAALHGWLGQGGLGILGASGAISGLIGFAIVRLPYARLTVAYWLFSPLQGQNRFGRCHLAMPLAVLGWLLLQVAGAALASQSGSQVSYPAHLGGFVLGALLALTMGGLREGRAEAILKRARQYLACGEGLAAAGTYAEYEDFLDHSLPDPSVHTERARALLMGGVVEQATAVYRDAFRHAVTSRRWDRALDILAEGWRCRPGLGLSADELSSAAHRAEKAGNRELARWIYQDFVQSCGDHPASNRAWVRLLMLLQDERDRRLEAQQWLEKARLTLAPGVWRDYIERYVTLQPPDRAVPAKDPAARFRAPGV